MYPDGQQGPGSEPVSPQNQQPPVEWQGTQPQGPDNYFQVQPEPVNKKKKMLIISLVVTAVVLIVASVALYLVLTFQEKPIEQIKKEAGNLKSSAVVIDIKKKIEATFPKEEVKEGEVATKPALVLEDQAMSPVAQADGYLYSIRYKSEAAFTYAVTNPAPVEPAEGEKKLKEVPVESVADVVRAYFKAEKVEAKDMSKEVEAAEEAAKDSLVPSRMTNLRFEGRGIVCTLTAEDETNKQYGNLQCGDLDEFKRISADIQPFIHTLPGPVDGMVFMNLDITASDTGGYQKASMVISQDDSKDRTAHFYKKESGRWAHLATEVEVKLACTTYSSIEAQRAFLNTACVDPANKNATVQVTEKKR